ncbi:LysR family transcriptional regulator [Mesorhizobium sp. L2C066B000]|uniref:LysR family transcriptional regulator n=1 Tax=Mesorhizobium sp. L2C066B000 TaxID=1287105 RepID=UPI0003D06A02|nr:LysR family transcriptional regulator [Mesorhizobium sp. L2C066B000]ESZ26507.1 LysR family transcriptional regulator [Mesorhizobium sp. L2C066B000]
MQLDHIETFLDIIESRNFNRTADRLGLTQSTISTRIKNLESAIGSELFQRGRAGAEPTAAGRRFEAYARSLVSTWSQARHDVRAFNRFEGTLRVAAQVGMTRSVLPGWVETLCQALPKSSIHVESDYSNQMVSDLSMGNLDIAVLYAPRYLPEIAYEHLMVEEYVMVSTAARNLSDVDPDTYIRPGYTVVLEKTHAEMLAQLAICRLSTGSEALAEIMLRRTGGTCYMRSDDARRFTGELPSFLVEGAPTLHQPVHTAILARRKHEPIIRKGIRALHIAVMSLEV